MKILSGKQILFFKNDNVLRLEANNDHTIIHFVDGKQTEISESLGSIEPQLKDAELIRIHDRHIVNVNYISRIAGGKDELLELSNAEVLPINSKQKEIIIELLSEHLKNH